MARLAGQWAYYQRSTAPELYSSCSSSPGVLSTCGSGAHHEGDSRYIALLYHTPRPIQYTLARTPITMSDLHRHRHRHRIAKSSTHTHTYRQSQLSASKQALNPPPVGLQCRPQPTRLANLLHRNTAIQIQRDVSDIRDIPTLATIRPQRTNTGRNQKI